MFKLKKNKNLKNCSKKIKKKVDGKNIRFCRLTVNPIETLILENIWWSLSDSNGMLIQMNVLNID